MSATDQPRSSEPIAVIGMAARFAGAADPDRLWDLLVNGVDAVREVPRDRFDVDDVYDPTPRTPGRTVSRWGGFLEDIAGFDSEFFGIAPREADLMDPQQRLLLEVAYEALEDAGQPLPRVAGTDTGVFVGQLGGDYWLLQCRAPQNLDLYAMTGAASRAVTSGRLSYAFDLRGPSLTLDTACSSALVAIHHAVQALRAGECPMAIAGGVNIVLLPEDSVIFSGAGMLARDGRCKFGDGSGDGFVRSDGIATVVLKPLAQALADGDRIRAVIRGTAVGNDGRSSGYLVTPAVEGQRSVLTRAYRDAGLSPADVDYVEAHGTGTSVGDPVELEALASVIGQGRPTDRPCLVGSVKTNIGHTEAAAGIAGLVKAVLCLEHGQVPPSLHLRSANPAVPWDELPLRIPTALTPLQPAGRPAVAAVSSFGFSGTNAHIVLEAAPRPVTPATAPPDRAELLVLSALTPEGLGELASSMADHLDRGAGRHQPLRDIAYSAAVRRTHHDARLAVPMTSREQAATALRSFVAGDDEPGLAFSDYTDSTTRRRVAFVFPGQGSQWLGMGRGLLRQEPVFAATMEACDTAIREETGWSVLDLLRSGSSGRLAELDVVQPTLWAMEIALAELWRSWGVEPDVVIGHSMGESAAAYVSGALSLPDAAAVICRRSRLAKRLSGQGAMAWVGLPADEARAALAGHEDAVAVAAVNSPTSALLSGESIALGAILAALDARGVANRMVKVDFASHCPQVDSLREDLLDALKDLTPRPGRIPLHSTLLGHEVGGSGLDAEYWVRNIREPVGFADAVRDQLATGDTVFIEASPHPLLVNAIRETGRVSGHHDVLAVGSLRRDEDERAEMLAAAGALHVAGVPLDLASLVPGGRYAPLPHYPWQHTRHWLPEAAEPVAQPIAEPVAEPVAAPVTPMEHGHPLLGAEAVTSDETRVWESSLDLTRNAYLLDHRVQEAVILPGTAHVELMVAAARQVLGPVAVALSGVTYHRAVFIGETGAPPRIRTTTSPTDDGQLRCRILTLADDGVTWQLHSEALARAVQQPAAAEAVVDEIRARCATRQSGADFYPWHAARGNQWHGAFQGIEELWRGDGEVLAALRCPSSLLPELAHHHFHPALLDAGGHTLVGARPDVEAGEDNVFVLGGIDEIRLYTQPSERLHSHARLVRCERQDSFAGDVRILDAEGHLVAEFIGLRLQYLAGRAPAPLAAGHPDVAVAPAGSSRCGGAECEAPDATTDHAADDWMHEVHFVRVPAPAGEAGADRDEPPGDWLVFTDSGPTGRRLLARLRARGQRAVVVTAAASYQTAGSDRYSIRPDRPDDYRAVLEELAARRTFRGIVHLWALDATGSADPSTKELARAEQLACGSAVHLLQALDEHPLPGVPRLWLVTRSAQAALPGDAVAGVFQAPLWGLGRAAAVEHPALHVSLADLDRTAAGVETLVDEMLAGRAEDQLAVREGTIRGARLRRRPVAGGPAARPSGRLTAAVPGLVDDLALHAVPQPGAGPGEVVIEVTHAALNYRDVLMAVGSYPGQSPASPPRLGWECVGRVVATGPGVRHVGVGDDVVAVAEGALATHVVAKAPLVLPRPARLDPAEAATIPLVFLTAQYALADLAHVGPDDRVLIHSATGGVGLAGLQIARSRRAQVFTTAGSSAKRRYLTDDGVQYVGDSRSLDFAEEIRAATDGAGVDVVLNGLAGQAIQANLDLMAPYGRYLELSKRDILDGSSIGLAPFARNLSFHSVDVVHMINHRPERAGAVLSEVFRLVEEGVLAPLPFTEYPVRDAAKAFGLMLRSGHIGKIVLSFTDLPDILAPVDAGGLPATPRPAGDRPAAPLMADSPAPTPSLRPDATYLVTGGAGGIGGQVAEWLVEHGARHLLLTGRRQMPQPDGWDAFPSTDPRAATVRQWKRLTDRGADVEYASVDVADLEAMRTLLDRRRAAGDPPVRGVFHAAGTIDYVPLRDLTDEHLAAMLRSKVRGAWALHRLLADADLDLFVLFSSGSSVLGSPLLGGYAAGNAFLDALAHHRRARHAPATVINWGFWDEVGMVARREREDGRTLLPQGMSRFQPDAGLDAMARVLATGATQVAVLPADWPRWARAYPQAAGAPLLSELVPDGGARAAETSTEAPTHRAETVPAPATPAPAPVAPAPVTPAPAAATAAAAPAVQDAVVRQVAQVLGLRPERVNVNRPLNRMGLDSLMAVELRNRLERELHLKLPIVSIVKGASVRSIVEHLGAAPSGTPATPAPAPAPVAATPVPAPVTPATPVPAPVTPATPAPAPVAPATPAPAPATTTAAAPAVQDAVVRQVAQVLGLRPERVNVNRPLNRMGLDSLMAVELRNRLERELHLKLPIVTILNGATVSSVSRFIGEAQAPTSSVARG